MNRFFERRRNFISCIAFLVIILILAIGGYFFTNYLTNEDHHEKSVQNSLNNLKTIADKDFVYYENINVISDEPDITYKDIIINLPDAKTVNDILKSGMDEIRNSVKKISESELDPNREVLYEEADIYSAVERNYAVYESLHYLSVLVTNSNFNCYDGSTIDSQSSYNFSLDDGKILSNQKLLETFNVSFDQVRSDLEKKLNSDQIDFNGENNIHIDETLNSINIDNAALYINKSGKLSISVLVKTDQGSYNDTIELN